jgi:hypothetical protein
MHECIFLGILLEYQSNKSFQNQPRSSLEQQLMITWIVYQYLHKALKKLGGEKDLALTQQLASGSR